MAWFTFVIYVLSFLLPPLHFFLGEQSDKSIRKQLEELFFKVEYGDWSELLRICAAGYLGYLAHIFGSEVLSIRFFWRVLLYSIALTTTVIVVVVIYKVGSLDYIVRYSFYTSGGSDIFRWIVSSYFAVLLANYFADLASLTVLVGALRRTRLAGPLHVVIAMFLAAVGTYVLFVAAVCLSSSYSLYSPVIGISWFELIERCVPWTLRHPTDVGTSAFFYIDFSFLNISVIVPILLYLFVVGASLLLYLSRSLTQAPMALVLDRLEKQKLPILVIVASVLFGIASILLAKHALFG